MSTFITTTGISHHIEQLINEAENFLILISPYIKFPPGLKKLINQRIRESDILVYIICREKDFKEVADKKWIEINDNIILQNSDNLHAKCYINEKSAIITSMNFYEYSMINNIEFGMVINRVDDWDNYSLVINECNRLFDYDILGIQIIKAYGKHCTYQLYNKSIRNYFVSKNVLSAPKGTKILITEGTTNYFTINDNNKPILIKFGPILQALYNDDIVRIGDILDYCAIYIISNEDEQFYIVDKFYNPDKRTLKEILSSLSKK